MLKPLSQLKQRLNVLLCTLPLLASGPLLANSDNNWQQTLEEAKGQTVYFNAWGGSPEINAYLVWVGQELAHDYQVKLVQVKVDDIAQSVSQLLANKQAGKQAGGPIDLLWVNGENFKALKEQGLLGAPFTAELPNMALVDSSLPVSEDFTLPVEGLEAPWGIGQLNLMVDTEEVARAPTSAAALLAWAKAHPGRFTYPKPPQFHGSSFLKQILLELTPNPAPSIGKRPRASLPSSQPRSGPGSMSCTRRSGARANCSPAVPPKPANCSMMANWPWLLVSTRRRRKAPPRLAPCPPAWKRSPWKKVRSPTAIFSPSPLTPAPVRGPRWWPTSC